MDLELSSVCMQPGAVVEMIWVCPWETVLLNRSLHLGQTLRQTQASLCPKYGCAATGVVKCGEGTCVWRGVAGQDLGFWENLKGEGRRRYILDFEPGRARLAWQEVGGG